MLLSREYSLNKEIDYQKDIKSFWKASRYSLEYIVPHLLESGEKEKAYRLIFGNKAWLEVKSSREMGFSSLLHDLDLIAKRLSTNSGFQDIFILLDSYVIKTIINAQVTYYTEDMLKLLIYLGRKTEAINHIRVRDIALRKISGHLAVYQALLACNELIANSILEESIRFSVFFDEDWIWFNWNEKNDLDFLAEEIIKAKCLWWAMDIIRGINDKRARTLNLFAITRALLAQNQYDEIIQILETENIVWDARICHQLIDGLLKQNRFMDALRITNIINGERFGQEKVDEIVNVIRALCKNKHFKQAMDLAFLIDELPRRISALFEIIQAYCYVNDYIEAEKVLDMSLQLLSNFDNDGEFSYLFADAAVILATVGHLQQSLSQAFNIVEGRIIGSKRDSIKQIVRIAIDHDEINSLIEYAAELELSRKFYIFCEIISSSGTTQKYISRKLTKIIEDELTRLDDKIFVENAIEWFVSALIQAGMFTKAINWLKIIKDINEPYNYVYEDEDHNFSLHGRHSSFINDVIEELIKLNKYSHALRLVDYICEGENKNCRGYYIGKIGIALAQDRQIEKAIKLMKQVNDSLLIDNFIEVLCNLGETNLAYNYINKIALHDKDSSICLIISALIKKHQYGEATNLALELSEAGYFSRKSEMLSNIILDLINKGDLNQAIEKVAFIKDPKQRINLLGKISLAKFLSGEKKKAIEILRDIQETCNELYSVDNNADTINNIFKELAKEDFSLALPFLNHISIPELTEPPEEILKLIINGNNVKNSVDLFVSHYLKNIYGHSDSVNEYHLFQIVDLLLGINLYDQVRNIINIIDNSNLKTRIIKKLSAQLVLKNDLDKIDNTDDFLNNQIKRTRKTIDTIVSYCDHDEIDKAICLSKKTANLEIKDELLFKISMKVMRKEDLSLIFKLSNMIDNSSLKSQLFKCTVRYFIDNQKLDYFLNKSTLQSLGYVNTQDGLNQIIVALVEDNQIDKILEISTYFKTSLEKIWFLKDIAKELIRVERQEKAKEILDDYFQRIISNSNDLTSIDFEQMARAYLISNHLDKAFEYAQRMDLIDDQGFMLGDVAKAYVDSGDLDNALKIASEIDRSSYGKTRAYEDIVEVLIQKGRSTEALKIIKNIDSRFSQRSSLNKITLGLANEARFNQALDLVELKDPMSLLMCVVEWRKVLGKSPNNIYREVLSEVFRIYSWLHPSWKEFVQISLKTVQ